uniref:Uncharacterized protein n=1 Tax=Salix viminalis TaxID=40686 RepID=A0A6N2MQW5_SALVM
MLLLLLRPKHLTVRSHLAEAVPPNVLPLTNLSQGRHHKSQAPYRDSCGKTVGEVPRLAPSEGCTDKAFDKSDTVKSPNKPGCERREYPH